MPPKGNSKDWALEKLQIGPARLVCLPRVARSRYLGYFNRIDLALDPIPYTGHSTALEGLWMGVSPVSLAGPPIASRGSFSILSNLGLADLVVEPRANMWLWALRCPKTLTAYGNCARDCAEDWSVRC